MKNLPTVLSPFGPCRPDFQHYKLDNGLQVVLCPDYFKPSVAVCVTYHAGSSMEEPGKTGIAHLIEHLFCNRTEHFPYPELDQAVLKMGGKQLAYSTRDLVWSLMTAPRDALEKMLRIEADRMGYFIHTITQEDIDKERKVIIQEIIEYDKYLLGNPWYLAQSLLFEKPHPYHHNTFGEFEDIFKWKLDDVRQFFQQYFVPNNAVITITGDFNSDSAKQLVSKYFADIPSGFPLTAPDMLPFNLTQNKSFVWLNPNCKTPLLVFYLPLPSLDDNELVVMELIFRCFIGQRKTPLNALMYENDLATRVSFGIDVFERSSYLKLLINVKQGVNMNELISRWNEYVRSFPEEGIEISGMADTINEYLQFRQPGLKKIDRLCTQMCHDTILRGRPDAIFDDFEAADKLIRDDLMAMFYKLFYQKPYMTFGILPPDQLSLAVENAVVYKQTLITEVAEKAQPFTLPRALPLPLPFSSIDRSIDPPYLPNTPEIEHPEVWTKTFDNGMRLSGIKSGYEHQISLSLILKGGILFEPQDKRGLTYILTKVWGKCRRADGGSKIVSEFMNFNAELKLRSYSSYTEVEIHFDKKHFASVVSLLEAFIMEAKFDQQTFEEAKEATLRMIDRLKSFQYEQSDILAYKILCGNNSPHGIPKFSPYGNRPECINNVTSDDIAQYFSQYFSPHFVHWLVYGNIRPEECVGYFSSLADKWRKEAPVAIPQAIINPEKPGTYEHRVPGSAQSYLQLILPLAKSKQQREIEFFVALHPLIMHGFRNLIMAELRVKNALTYSNHNFLCTLYDEHYFSSTFFIDAQNEKAAISLIDDIFAAYPEIYTEDMFEKSRQRILRERIVHFEKPERYMTLLTDIALYDLPTDHYERETAILMAMTYEQAREIVNRNFGEKRHSWVIV